MTSVEFCYWLQGYFELGEARRLEPGITGEQAKCIQRHLAMVFVHEIDPSHAGPPGHQERLADAHEGVPMAKLKEAIEEHLKKNPWPPPNDLRLMC
jgi:hypothetical protein